MRGHRIQEYISHALDTNRRLRRNFGPPDPSTDILYQPSAVHDFSSSSGCTENCNDESIVKRPDRPTDEDNPVIYYGLIASGNTVLKDAVVRDRLAREKDILCFEMEAAGLMNQFPCIVIRVICDYADSHKNKDWQGYAALSAAAYTKDLLSQITPNRLASGRRINDIISGRFNTRLSIVPSDPSQCLTLLLSFYGFSRMLAACFVPNTVKRPNPSWTGSPPLIIGHSNSTSTADGNPLRVSGFFGQTNTENGRAKTARPCSARAYLELGRPSSPRL
jgi:hypothetical protein